MPRYITKLLKTTDPGKCHLTYRRRTTGMIGGVTTEAMEAEGRRTTIFTRCKERTVTQNPAPCDGILGEWRGIKLFSDEATLREFVSHRFILKE